MGESPPSCLLVCVLLVALLGLGLAGLALGWRIYDELLGGAALRDRLDHLEQVGSSLLASCSCSWPPAAGGGPPGVPEVCDHVPPWAVLAAARPRALQGGGPQVVLPPQVQSQLLAIVHVL